MNSNLYGAPISKAVSNSSTSKNFKLYGVKFPFGELKKGGFLKKSSDLEVVKSGLVQLLLTSRGERLMLPNFGTNLKNYLMEPLDQVTFTGIRREIQESFARYARDVDLVKIQIFPYGNKTLSGGHSIYIKLFCVLKQNNDQFELGVNIV